MLMIIIIFMVYLCDAVYFAKKYIVHNESSLTLISFSTLSLRILLLLHQEKDLENRVLLKLL